MNKFSSSILVVLLLSACSKQEQTEVSQGVEIKLSAGINNLTSRAAIDAWADTPVCFAKGSETATYIDLWDAVVASTGDVTFSPIQYYPPTATEQVFLKGYAPRGTFDAGIATFSGMNGTQDILLSGEVFGGILDRFNQPGKEFTFNHLLAQLNFTVIADHTFADGANLTSIIVNGTKLPVSMNVASGVITYAVTATPISSFAGIQAITETVSSKLGTIMVEPGKPVTLTVVAGGVTYNDVPVTIDTDTTPQANTAYTVALTFKSVEIGVKVTVSPWTLGTGSGIVI